MRKSLFLVVLLTSVAAFPNFGQDSLPQNRLVVPDINGLATTLIKPAFPETAVDGGADGTSVTLKVIVDETGTVVSAKCATNCHPMLRDAAELAAMTSKFKPVRSEGRPVSYEGILYYTFVVRAVNWYRFGTSIESTRQFDNIGFGPAAGMLSDEFKAEKSKLTALDANGGAEYDTRQRVISEVVSSVKSRLKGIDLWRFEIGMALRRVTFWTLAGERTDRAEMQRAIDDLPAVIALAPEGVSPAVIKGLTAMSKYRVSADLPEGDLRRAINDLARQIPNDLQ